MDDQWIGDGSGTRLAYQASLDFSRSPIWLVELWRQGLLVFNSNVVT